MYRSLQLLALACLMAVVIPTNASAEWRRSLGSGYASGAPAASPGKSARAAGATKTARSTKSAKATRTARASTSSDDDTPVRRSRSRGTSTASSSSRSITSTETGIASYYWQPQRVASGGWFNPNAMTAAHKYLPFGTRVRVTHASSGRSVEVTINDRGPYIRGRIIDLSRAAAGVIGMQGSGIAPVRVDILGR